MAIVLARPGLVARLLPARCPGCGDAGEPLCRACAARLRPAPDLPPPAGIEAWVAPLAYDGVARELVARLKYRQERATIPLLAALMVAALARIDQARVREVVAVTWVPASAARRRVAGTDHGALLARAVARRIGRPCRRTLRRAPGPAQTGRSRAARRGGPDLVSRCALPPVRLLLVDDVATTGASLAAAARALRRAGARAPLAVTAARTPAPGSRVDGFVY